MIKNFELNLIKYIKESNKFVNSQINPSPNKDNLLGLKIFNSFFINLLILNLLFQVYLVESSLVDISKILVFSIVVSRSLLNFFLIFRFVKNLIFKTSESSINFYFIFFGFLNMVFHLLIFF